METFIISFIVMLAAVLAMAIGVFMGRNPIKGSCGGINKLDGVSCECSAPCEKKRRLLEHVSEKQ